MMTSYHLTSGAGSPISFTVNLTLSPVLMLCVDIFLVKDGAKPIFPWSFLYENISDTVYDCK